MSEYVPRAARGPGLADRWFRSLSEFRSDLPTVLVFPHAGGSANFYSPLAPVLGDVANLTAVQYPGRLDRHREAMPDDPVELIQALREAYNRIDIEGPRVFFGHSMGAAIAFELLLALGSEARCDHVILSARAPRYTPAWTPELTDQFLLCEIEKLTGSVPAPLKDRDTRSFLLEPMRADYRVLRSLVQARSNGVSVPMTCVVGDSDPSVSAGQMESWSRLAQNGFSLRVFGGGHFYMTSQWQLLGEFITTLLPVAA